MSSIIDYIISVGIDTLIDMNFEQVNKMLDLKYKGKKEIARNFVNRGLEFGNECKYTLVEKNNSILNVTISHPGMEDLKYNEWTNSTGISQDILILFMKYGRL